MTRIAAISVQTVTRPAAVRPAAPVRPADAERALEPGGKPFAPEAAKVAAPAMAALIAAQAHRLEGHEDPHPEHGRDDDHGHAHQPPPVSEPPPVVQPPVTPPPPVVQPPIPVPTPAPPSPAPIPVVGDPAAAARANAMISRVFAEGAVADAARSVFAAAAAERRAAAYVAQGQAALAILQGIGRYESIRRSAIG